jgi:hypothetical protein
MKNVITRKSSLIYLLLLIFLISTTVAANVRYQIIISNSTGCTITLKPSRLTIDGAPITFYTRKISPHTSNVVAASFVTPTIDDQDSQYFLLHFGNRPMSYKNTVLAIAYKEYPWGPIDISPNTLVLQQQCYYLYSKYGKNSQFMYININPSDKC